VIELFAWLIVLEFAHHGIHDRDQRLGRSHRFASGHGGG
jgi:hypothetical protein